MHYLRADYRIESLTQIITGLNSSINCLMQKNKEFAWYDVNWLLQDVEPILGLAMVAFQNYINSSIADCPIRVSSPYKIMELGHVCDSYEKSKIELIIGLANYYKHKEESDFHKKTREILDYFGLATDKDLETHETPIFKGIEILNNKSDLFEIMHIVEAWREQLWLRYEREQISTETNHCLVLAEKVSSLKRK